MIESLHNEIWNPIKGFEEYYHISSIGRVKSLSRRKGYKNQHSEDYTYKWTEERILIPLRKLNYECVLLYGDNGCTYHQSVHRLVAMAYLDNPENKPQVNHKNGVRNDNRLENLEWCTSSENTKHAYDTKLRALPFGALNHASKIVVNLNTGIFYDSTAEAADSIGMNKNTFRSKIRVNKDFVKFPFIYAIHG